jgi:hypothetical protein
MWGLGLLASASRDYCAGLSAAGGLPRSNEVSEMVRSSRLMAVLCALSLLLGALPLTASAGSAAQGITLADQGWRVVQQQGKKQIEVRVLVTNQTKAPLRYQVRFFMEVREPSKAAAEAAKDAIWSTLKTVTVEGGPLAPGASQAVTGLFPYELLQKDRAFRFRAELVESDSGAVLGAAAITAKAGALLSGAGAVAAAAVAGVGLSRLAATGHETPSTPAPSGSGTMSGQHESRRVNGQWVEHGSGTIDVTGPSGRLVLEYSYDAQGASASDVTASATASGQLIPAAGEPQAVNITSASAQISRPGLRQQSGQTVTRVGGYATGTFSGTVGGTSWTGVLTLSDGDMTLDLSTGQGTHEFQVQFTASQSG